MLPSPAAVAVGSLGHEFVHFHTARSGEAGSQEPGLGNDPGIALELGLKARAWGSRGLRDGEWDHQASKIGRQQHTLT